MNDEDGPRSGRDSGFNFARIKIECGGFDVDKNGNRPLHANYIGGDECERRNDDLVACGDAEAADAKMKPAGAGVGGDRMTGSHIVGGGALKGFQFEADAELRR